MTFILFFFTPVFHSKTSSPLNIFLTQSVLCIYFLFSFIFITFICAIYVWSVYRIQRKLCVEWKQDMHCLKHRRSKFIHGLVFFSFCFYIYLFNFFYQLSLCIFTYFPYLILFYFLLFFCLIFTLCPSLEVFFYSSFSFIYIFFLNFLV